MIARKTFEASLGGASPPAGFPPALEALWWEKKGDWRRAHELVNELASRDAMAVHGHLHRREGDLSNADYWYRRGGRACFRESLDDEWEALLEALLAQE